jgi:hypothetical protein
MCFKEYTTILTINNCNEKGEYMKRRKFSAKVLFFFLMTFVMVAGCSKSDDAVAPPYKISGAVTGTATGTTTIAADGTYSFALGNGTYTLTPVLAGNVNSIRVP